MNSKVEALTLLLCLAPAGIAQAQIDRWMDDLVDFPRCAVDSPMDQKFSEFILPGSHDSAMNARPAQRQPTFMAMVVTDRRNHAVDEYGFEQ